MMADGFDYYRAPPPPDLSRQFSDLVANAPGQGLSAAARALRESLERRQGRQDRIRERESDRTFQLDMQTRQENFQRSQQITGEEAQMQRDARQRDFQRGEHERDRMMKVEEDSLNRAADERKANAAANAHMQERIAESQDKVDEQQAYGAAQAALTGLKVDKNNPFFRSAKINPAQALYTNASEDELLNIAVGAQLAARPYLDEGAQGKLKTYLKEFNGPREVVMFDPAGQGNLRVQVTNQALSSLGTGGRISRGHQLGIERAIMEGTSNLPPNEHEAAKALEGKFKEQVEKAFGSSAAPAQPDQRTQALQGGTAAMAQQPLAPVAIRESDFPDEFLAGMSGSLAQGQNMKARIFGAGGMGQLPIWIPKPQPNGEIAITIEGVDPGDKAIIEKAANTPGPYRDQILGGMKAGNAPATETERKKAGSAPNGEGAAPAAPQKDAAPAQGSASPAPKQTTAPGLPIQKVAPDLLKFINGKPKK